MSVTVNSAAADVADTGRKRPGMPIDYPHPALPRNPRVKPGEGRVVTQFEFLPCHSGARAQPARPESMNAGHKCLGKACVHGLHRSSAIGEMATRAGTPIR